MSFGTLALVVLAGLLGPVLAGLNRFAPPVVVGQVVAGIIIGRSGFGWVSPDDPLLVGLAAIGFALLMFVVGTHLPVRDPGLRTAVVAGSRVAATTLVLAVGAARLVAMATGFHHPWILAVLVATSSGAVVLPVLQARQGSDPRLLVVTVWVAMADVVTVLAVPLVLATGALFRVVVGGTVTVAAAAAVFLAARLLRGRARVMRAQQESRARGWALELRISLVLLFALAWLASRFGSSILIAGFSGGVVVSLLGEPRRVADQLVGLGEGFLIPVFFVHLGMTLDLEALFRSRSDLLLAVALAGAAVVAHVGAAVVWRLPPAAGLLASAQLGVPAAVVSIGLSTALLRPGQGAAIMASVLFTLVATTAGSFLLGQGRQVSDAMAPRLRLPRPRVPE